MHHLVTGLTILTGLCTCIIKANNERSFSSKEYNYHMQIKLKPFLIIFDLDACVYQSLGHRSMHIVIAWPGALLLIAGVTGCTWSRC